MICAVNDAQRQQHFVDALAPADPVCVQLGAHIQAFGKSPGSGRQFYTTEQERPPFALEVTGDTARCAGACDEEELGSFLRFLGVQQVFWQGAAPAGYELDVPVERFCLAAGQSLPLTQQAPPMGLVLEKEPAMGPVTQLLMQGDPEKSSQDFFDAFYAAACALRNRGLAQIWALTETDGTPVVTCGAYAFWQDHVYLSALHTRSDLRRQGIGSWLVCAQANHMTAQGLTAEFLCEKVLAGYYRALGFCPVGTMQRYRAVQDQEK